MREASALTAMPLELPYNSIFTKCNAQLTLILTEKKRKPGEPLRHRRKQSIKVNPHTDELAHTRTYNHYTTQIYKPHTSSCKKVVIERAFVSEK